MSGYPPFDQRGALNRLRVHDLPILILSFGLCSYAKPDRPAGTHTVHEVADLSRIAESHVLGATPSRATLPGLSTILWRSWNGSTRFQGFSSTSLGAPLACFSPPRSSVSTVPTAASPAATAAALAAFFAVPLIFERVIEPERFCSSRLFFVSCRRVSLPWLLSLSMTSSICVSLPLPCFLPALRMSGLRRESTRLFALT
jgi:hypothetical protein